MPKISPWLLNLNFKDDLQLYFKFASVLIDFICRNVLSIDEYSSCFDNIDPLAHYKKWSTRQEVDQNSTLKMKNTVYSQRVQAAFVVSDSVDWSRDIQVVLNLQLI